LFLAGLVVWTGMVLIHANDPMLRSNYKLQVRSNALSRRFQVHFDKIILSQVRPFNGMSSSRRPLRLALGDVHDEVESLADALHDLCQRMSGPTDYY
jgi:hypothetical protein